MCFPILQANNFAKSPLKKYIQSSLAFTKKTKQEARIHLELIHTTQKQVSEEFQRKFILEIFCFPARSQILEEVSSYHRRPTG